MRLIHIFDRILCAWRWVWIIRGVRIVAFSGIGLCSGIAPAGIAPVPVTDVPPVENCCLPLAPFPEPWGYGPTSDGYGPDTGGGSGGLSGGGGVDSGDDQRADRRGTPLAPGRLAVAASDAGVVAFVLTGVPGIDTGRPTGPLLPPIDEPTGLSGVFFIMFLIAAAYRRRQFSYGDLNAIKPVRDLIEHPQQHAPLRGLAFAHVGERHGQAVDTFKREVARLVAHRASSV